MNPSDDPFVACARAGRPVDHCLVVDAHGHLGEYPSFSVLGDGADSLVRAMDRLGIAVAALSSAPACLGGLTAGNDDVIAAVRRHPQRLIGYMAVNPGYPDEARAELQRCLQAGLAAVKIHDGLGIAYDDARWRLVYEFAAEHGLPILAHTWGDNLNALEPHFSRYDRVNWILAHSGASQRERYVRLANTYPNVFLETCLSMCPRGLIEYFVAHCPRDKIVWGSDATFLAAAGQLGRVLWAKISPEAKRAILGENARRILPLPEGVRNQP